MFKEDSRASAHGSPYHCYANNLGEGRLQRVLSLFSVFQLRLSLNLQTGMLTLRRPDLLMYALSRN